eukprot:Rhum_TRINITY_DN14744_c7_g1::Rhum_TRINITY_DN14744_c7_g1_i1::g.114223::m.114223
MRQHEERTQLVVGTVVSMLEEDKRMDIRWAEQLERGQARSGFLHALNGLRACVVAPQRTASVKDLLTANVLPTEILDSPEPSPRTRSQSRSRSLDAHRILGDVTDPLDLQRSLDLAARDNAKLRQAARNLQSENEYLRAKLDCDELSELADTIKSIPADPDDLRTPAEIAWNRALSLHHLPRTISEESLTDETYDWRATLESRESAILMRERVLQERETLSATYERKLADLDQQSKELAIKDREYKLRFRGIEERELKEGDLPRRLAEVDEREQALEQREQELQDRLDAVEELRRSLLDGTVHVDPAADAADTAADDAPPAVLVVEVPNLFEMAGEFTLMAEPHVGRPQWESDDRRLYHLGGRWAIGFEHEVDEGVAWVSTTQPHRNVLPHKITSWSFAPEEGAELEVDAGIKVRCG